MLLGDRVRWSHVEVTSTPDDAALLVAVLREDRTTLLGRGQAAGALRLVRERVERRAARGEPTAVGWMSLPRGGADDEPDDDLLGSLHLGRYSTWDWLVTDVVPPRAAAENRVERLADADADAIRDCLAVANPGTTADPTGPDQAAWFGVREGDALVGVFGASLRGADGDGFSWHLHGLGVRPSARSRGLGAALTAAITRAGLASGAAWVSLGMYADNATARRLYRRLGYVTAAEFASFGPPGARRPPT